VVEAAVGMAVALVEGAHTSAVAASVAVAFMEAALVAAVFAAAASAAVDFAAAAFTMAFAAIGLPSLAGLTILSFIIPMGTTPTRTTGTIPTAIIPTGTIPMAITLTLMDTVAFAAVGDPYNQPVYQGSAGYTDQLVGQIHLRLACTGY